MTILRFREFINEEISGTELVGPIGPAYGETRLQNKTINKSHTSVIYSEIDGNFYTEDDYNELYNNFLKSGGNSLQGGFTRENIDYILNYIR